MMQDGGSSNSDKIDTGLHGAVDGFRRPQFSGNPESHLPRGSSAYQSTLAAQVMVMPNPPLARIVNQ